MTSSASKPGTRSCEISSTESTSSISGNWLANRSGGASRCALYSAYLSLRNVGPRTSHATAIASGSSSPSSLMSIEVKPKTALVT